MKDKEKKRLIKMMQENNIEFPIVFLKNNEFNGIFNNSELIANMYTISIRKIPLIDHTLVDLNDEYIYIFEKDTNYFDSIKNFNITSKLKYSGVEVCAKYSEFPSFAKLFEQEKKESIDKQAKVIKSKEKGEMIKMIMLEQQFSKFRETGVAFSISIDYLAKIENGILRVELSELPKNICVGYELLRNMKVVESLSPSYVTKSSFELKYFGDYSVRVRFYKHDNLNITTYRYDTKHFIYTLSSVIGSLNPDRYDFKDAIDRFERLLFDESRHKERMGWFLSMLSHQTSLGYSFIDYLLSINVSSLYFYCDERDWELGRALFSLLYNDGRIKIQDCISEISFNGKSIGNLYPTVKFSNKNAKYYEVRENVLIVSVYPQPNLEYELKNFGLNLYKIDDVINASLKKGLFVSPYIEFKKSNPNVDIIFIQRPLPLRKVKKEERTDNENEIIAKKITMGIMRTWLRQNPPVIPLALIDCGVECEDAEEFLAFSSDMDSTTSGYAKPVDRRGRLVNVINGYRVTSNQPKQFDNTIYFYGNSMVYSPFTSDDKTVASFLQRLLNSNCKTSYKVVNCGGWTKQTPTNMINNIMKERKYKKGDKIVFMLSFLPNLDEVNYTLIDLKKLYARPHEYGEIWIDVHDNVNETGQKLIAEGLFNGLKENGLIKTKSRRTICYF